MTQCDRGKNPGETIEIGDMLGSGIEPAAIIGRVCGFVKDADGEVTEVIYRRYRTHSECWPTGQVVSRRLALAWPHMHFGDSHCVRLIQGEVTS